MPIHYFTNIDPIQWHICLSFGLNVLTLCARVTHVCIGKLTIIGSDNGLSPGLHQAIIRTNAGILLTGPLGTNCSEILIEIQTFSLKKMYLKMSSGKFLAFCLRLHVLTYILRLQHTETSMVGNIFKYVTRTTQACYQTEGTNKEIVTKLGNISLMFGYIYHQTSDISCTLVGNKIFDHSDVVGVSPISAAPTTSSFIAHFVLFLFIKRIGHLKSNLTHWGWDKMATIFQM